MIPTGTHSIKVEVTAADGKTYQQVAKRPADQTSVILLFQRLPGGSATATATAFTSTDGTGTAIATGSASFDVLENASSEVAIILNMSVGGPGSGSPLLTGRPSIGVNPDGSLEAFVRAIDNHVYHTWQSGGWPVLTAISGSTSVQDDPFVVSGSNQGLNLFAVGWDGLLHHIDQSQWNDHEWASIGNGVASGRPTVVLNARPGDSPYLEAFVHEQSTQGIFHSWENNGWGKWEQIYTQGFSTTSDNQSVTFIGSPAASLNSDGYPEVFARHATNNLLYHTWLIKDGGGDWARWEPLSDRAIGGDPAIGRNKDGREEVFAVDQSGTLCHIWQPDWKNWVNIGSGFSGTPAVASTQTGDLNVFVRGTDNCFYATWHDPAVDWVKPIKLFTQTFASDPAVARNSANVSPDVFGVGTDGKLYRAASSSQNNTWSDWQAIG